MYQQKGFSPIIFIIIACLAIIVFLLLTNTFQFKDRLFSTLYPKPPSQAQEQPPFVPGEILVKFKPGVPEEAKEKIQNIHALEKIDSIPQIEVDRMKVPSDQQDKLIEALNKNPLIEFAEPNFLAKPVLEPNDALYVSGDQWNLKKVAMPAAWDISKGSSQIVAVLDSGIYNQHEDLQGKILPGYNFVDNNTNTADAIGHGTAVSGVIGATTNNSQGIAALGWDIPILPLKVCENNGTCPYSALASAAIYAADHGAKSINISLGGKARSNTFQNAINYAWNRGVVSSAAAGNDGTCCILYPAAMDNVIAVGATDFFDIKANFSNTGPLLDVTAPGASIYSLVIIPVGGSNYIAYSGTSFSTPHVAALVALIFATNPGLTPQQVVDIITQTSLDLGPAGWDEQYGWGRIQADQALQKAAAITPADTTPPTVSITQPLDGSTVSSNSQVTIQANATDNVGVSKVEFYVNNKLPTNCTDTLSPYTCLWKVPNKKGTYTLKAQAYDTSNNANAATISVTAN